MINYSPLSTTCTLTVGGTATFASTITTGGELIFSTNNTGVTMKDASGTNTRVFRLNSGNTMYIGPIDTYAGGQIFYGAASQVTGHKFHVGGAAKLTIDSSGNTTFANNITVDGIATFKHGSTSHKTLFNSGNEINTFTAAGGAATMYLNWQSGAVNIGKGALVVANQGDTTIKGHLIPHADATYDLGTTASKDFRTLYVRDIDIYNQRFRMGSSGTTAVLEDHSTVGDGFQFLHLGTEILRLGNDTATSAVFAGDVTINGSHLKVLNHSGAYEGASTDYLYIGGNGLDSSDAAIYLGNAGNNTGYGWRFFYEGSGSGNLNRLIIKSENAGSGVDALAFTQDGKATFSQDATFTGNVVVGNKFQAAVGSASAPTYTFTGKTDTGMYARDHSSNDRLAFSVDGTERGYFDSNGLQVVGNVYLNDGNSFRNYPGTWAATTGTSGKGFTFANTTDNSGAVLLSITSNSSSASASVATFAGSINAGNTSKIEKAQNTTQFDRDCFLRLHPSATTNSGGYTNMIFGTSTTNNYGVAIGGRREGTGDTSSTNDPAFSVRILNDSITGTEVLNINTTGNATFTGNISSSGTLQLVGNTGSGFLSNFQNTSTSSSAYSGFRIRNSDTGFAEIWRNSTAKTSADQLALSLNMYNSADLNFWSGGSKTVGLSGNNATFVGNVQMQTGNSVGKFAIMSTAVHGSYDFYNNGTSYFNGGVVIDATCLFSDNEQLRFGAANDFLIYHNSTTNVNFISSQLDRQLHINANIIQLRNQAQNKTYLKLEDGGATFVGSLHLDSDSAQLQFGDDNDMQIYHNGAGGEINNATGDFTIDSVGDIILDADGGDWKFKDAGTSILEIQNDGNGNGVIIAPVSNKSIKFLGNDGGNTITALQLNMSDNGHAVFNSGISATNTSFNGTMNISGGIYHIGDTNTFFGFDEGNDTFRVVTGGGERLGVNNSGVRFGGGARVTTILDEDNMASNSATALATQQSIKAYVDNSISGGANYLGVWDPDDSLNNGYGNPSLQASTRTDTSGDYFICSADGAAHPNGGTTEPDSWHTGDWVVWNGDLGSSGLWQKIDNTTVLSGGGTSSSVAKFTDSETIGDGPIAFNGNTSVFFGNTEPSVNGSKDLGGASKRWATLYANNISTSTSSTFGGDLVLDDHIDASPNLYFYNQANNYARLQFSTSDELELKIGTSVKLTIGGTESSFEGKLAVNGSSVFADAELDVLGDITLINRNWALRGNNSNADFVIEKVVGNNFNDNNIALAITGGQKFVGIGTNNPLNRLVVSGIDTNAELDGTTVTQAALQLSNSDFAYGTFFGTLSNGTGLIQQRRQSSAVYYPLAINPYGGNVSIGTAVPLANLHVKSTSNTVLIIEGNQNTRFATLQLKNADQSWMPRLEGTSQDFVIRDDTAASEPFRINPATSTGSNDSAIIIDGDANVGIGTASPSEKLEVQDGNIKIETTTNVDAELILNPYSSALGTTYQWELVGKNSSNNYNFQIRENGTPHVTIDSSVNGNAGHVGIGTIDPNSKLDVRRSGSGVALELHQTSGSANDYVDLKMIAGNTTAGTLGTILRHKRDGSGGGDFSILTNPTLTGTPTEKLVVKSGGNVGIGTTSPAFKLDIDGTLGVSDLPFNTDSVSILVADETIGADLVTNGDFSTDANWTKGGSWTISGGKANYSGSGTSALVQNIALSGGVTYKVRFNISGSSGNGAYVWIGNAAGSINYLGGSYKYYQDGDYIEAFTMPSSQTTFSFYSNSTSSSYSLDNVSLKQVTSASNQIQKRELSSDIFTSGPFLPLSGGTMTGNLRLNDNVFVKFGNQPDFEIGHDASNSYISHTGVGNLIIRNTEDNADIIFQSDDGLGGLTEYFRVDGGESNTIFSRDLKFLDSGLPSRKAIFGTGDDLQIYHDASHSIIQAIGTGNLIIKQDTNDADIVFKSDNGSGGSTEYFRLDGGDARMYASREIRFVDGVASKYGNSGDLGIYHDGSGSYMENSTGHMYIMQRANDKDMYFQCDNGSGSDATYFYLDGGRSDGTNLATRFPDQSIILMGSGTGWNDGAQIYHSGSNFHINEYIGDIQIACHTNNGDIKFKSDDGSGGLTEYFRVDGGIESLIAYKDLLMAVDGNGGKIKLGASQDLQLFHDGNHSYIDANNTGDLYIRSLNDDIVIQAFDDVFIYAKGGEDGIKVIGDGAVELYHNNVKKFETSSAGVAVTGSLSTTEDISVSGDVMVTGTTTAGGTLICEGNITIQDSDKLQLGNSQDLELYHASGISYIDNDTGHLYIRNNVDNDDGSNIYIQAKSGENSIVCQDDGNVSIYDNNILRLNTTTSGIGAYGYIGFGSAGTSTGSSYGFRYGSSSPSGAQGIVISVSDTGGSYFDGVGRFQNNNTGQGAGMFQMVNYGSLYGRYMQFFRGSTSNIIGYIGYNSSNTSVTFSTTNSDIRTKKNITTWDENVLDKFKALQPKRFDFKVAIGDKGTVKERGFIAQYEKDNFPEAYQLNGNDEKATYGFHPMEMVPYMMKAIKDLTIKNEELERRIKTLES